MAACGPGSNGPPDGGPPLALDVLGSSQIGLHYGKSTELKVRYHTDDAAATAVAGASVRFSIFGDPAGSTLSRDTVTTDVNGVAAVTLTAGQAEKSFRVAATAVNASEADFDVSVSKFDFVEVDAKLAWSPAATLRALLYDAQTCAALPASPTLPPPARALSKANATEATLQFVNLLSTSYALVGRAEDADGKLLGYGCVDLPAELVPPGSVSVVPVPLTTVVPSATGVYAMTSKLVPVASAYASLVGTWQHFGGACPYGAAQALLDAMAISSHRDGPLANGCRPTSTTSLDFQLQQLLTAAPTAPANSLPAIAMDLVAITGAATVKSTLRVDDASPSTYTARHTLSSAEFAVSASVSKSYDLVPLGEPVIDDKNVPFIDDGTTATIGAHGFTLGWTTLWLQAFTDLSLAMRVTGLGSPAIRVAGVGGGGAGVAQRQDGLRRRRRSRVLRDDGLGHVRARDAVRQRAGAGGIGSGGRLRADVGDRLDARGQRHARRRRCGSDRGRVGWDVVGRGAGVGIEADGDAAMTGGNG